MVTSFKRMIESIKIVNQKFLNRSDAWIRVFTEVSAVQGIVKSLLISSSVSIGGLLLFTGDFLVTFYAFLSLLCNTIFMLAIYKLLGWTLGAIEAV
jgi:hypothetical protein